MVSEEPDDDVEDTADVHEGVSDDSRSLSLLNRTASENEPDPETRLAYELQTEEEQSDSEDVTPPNDLSGHAEAQVEQATLPSLHSTRVSLPPPQRDIPAILQEPPSSNVIPDLALQQPISPAVLEPAESVIHDDLVVETLPRASLVVQPSTDIHSGNIPVDDYRDAAEQQEEGIDETQHSPVPPIVQPPLPSRRLSTEVRSPTRSLPPPPPPPAQTTAETDILEDADPEHEAQEALAQTDAIDEDTTAQEDKDSNEYHSADRVATPMKVVHLLIILRCTEH
jgi:hypothetical protein